MQGLEAREHRGPDDTPPQTLTLTPHDVAALARYQQHVQRASWPWARRGLVLEDEA